MAANGIQQLVSIGELERAQRVLVAPAASGWDYFMEFVAAERPDLAGKFVGLTDRDPAKHGAEGHGLPVGPPESAPALDPDMVLITSPLNRVRIEEDFRPILPDVPMVLADDLDAYVDWEARRSRILERMPPALPEAEVRRMAAEPPFWFQQMPFGPGLYARSNKGALTFRLLEQMNLAEDMRGLSVLDAGASDGFYAFECEARGASRVMAVDGPGWRAEWGLKRFLAARDIYGSKAEHMVADVEELNADRHGRFDVVLCLGLYYHLQDPLRVLRSLAEMTRQRLYLTGRIVNLAMERPLADQVALVQDQEVPYMIFNPKVRKWTANLRCLTDMLESAGFARVETTFNHFPPGSWVGSVAVTAFK